MGSIPVATTAATLFVATMLVVSMALLPTPLSYSSGLRAGKTGQALHHTGSEEDVADGGRRQELRRRMSSAGEGGGNGGGGTGDAGLSPLMFPLTSAKRQVPTGADPIHHNERPPSLPHRHFP